MKPTLHRGFLRMLVVLSVAWLIVVTVLVIEGRAEALESANAPNNGLFWHWEWRARDLGTDLIEDRQIPVKTYEPFRVILRQGNVAFAVVGPISLAWVGYFCLRWIVLGFRVERTD